MRILWRADGIIAMPYKAANNWVMVKRNGRWVRLKKHASAAKAKAHAGALNRNVRHK